MQLNLFSRLKGARIGTAAAVIATAAVLLAFCAAAVLLLPRGESGSVRSVSEERLMTGGDSTTDPLEYAELLPDIKININTAGTHALKLLPGIDDRLAEKIIAFREENGDFEAIEDIMKVSGIGEGTFELVKDHISTGDGE